MTDDNRTRLIKAAKIVALVLWAGMTIITCSGVWNFCTEPFVNWVAGGLLATNGFAIYKKFKNVYKN